MGEINQLNDAVYHGVSQSDQGVNTASGQAAQEQFKKIHWGHKNFPDSEKTDDPCPGQAQQYSNPTHDVLS